jgi:hypothetical protein
MFLQESRHYIGAESEGDPTIVLAPTRDVFVRVGPQEVTQEATVGDLQVV